MLVNTVAPTIVRKEVFQGVCVCVGAGSDPAQGYSVTVVIAWSSRCQNYIVDQMRSTCSTV